MYMSSSSSFYLKYYYHNYILLAFHHTKSRDHCERNGKAKKKWYANAHKSKDYTYILFSETNYVGLGVRDLFLAKNIRIRGNSGFFFLLPTLPSVNNSLSELYPSICACGLDAP